MDGNHERTSIALADSRSDHQKLFLSTQSMQKQLDEVKCDVDANSANLKTTMKKQVAFEGEIGKFKNNMAKLENCVEFASAGFAGMQKGFTAGGAVLHASTSPVLPKLKAQTAFARHSKESVDMVRAASNDRRSQSSQSHHESVSKEECWTSRSP